MKFFGRFDGLHQRLTILEQRLSDQLEASGANQAEFRLALAADLQALRQDLGDVTKELGAALPPVMDAARADIAALPPLMDATRADIAALPPLMDATRADIAALPPLMDATRADIAALPPLMDAARADIAALPPLMDATRADIAALAPVVENLAAALGERVAAAIGILDDRLDAIGLAMAANHQELRSDHLELRSDHQELRSELTRTAPPTEAEAEALPVKGLPRPLPGEAVRITPPLPSAYFIVGCGRSGTTSLVRILDKAANGICRSEPGPILGLESRLLREGRLDQPFAALTRTIAPRIADTLDQGLIYGEKNLTLPPFIPHLHALFRCRFVHVIRDGRDVVRSWLDWHDQVYGNIYRECREPGHLSPRAREWVATYPAAEDEYDTSRPRPLPNDPWHDLWPGMRRLEMLAWHWVRTNEDIIAGLDRLAPDHWRALDYSHVDTSRIMELIAFLGLTGLDAATVEAMLTAKINRLEEMAPDCVRFPAWGDWSETDKVAFDAIAHPTMRRLGYYPPGQGRYRPRDLVTAWPGDDAGSTGDLEWLRRHIEGARPQSIRQAGGSAARSLFADAGVETVAADQWIEQSRPPVSLALARSDVWSRLWDIESGLDRLMAESRDALFVSFRDSGLTEHRHRRDSGTGLYDNDVSLIAIRRQLAEGRWQIAHCAVHQGLTVLLARPGILPDRGGDR